MKIRKTFQALLQYNSPENLWIRSHSKEIQIVGYTAAVVVAVGTVKVIFSEFRKN